MSKTAFKDIPRGGLIKENETITLFSIFDFKGGVGELFPFLYMCRELNCTVVFENEGIKVIPDDRDIMQNTQLSIYATIAMEPKIVNDYIKYLSAKM
jgi:hypothetical protein